MLAVPQNDRLSMKESVGFPWFTAGSLIATRITPRRQGGVTLQDLHHKNIFLADAVLPFRNIGIGQA